jgi:hypothetical protein
MTLTRTRRSSRRSPGLLGERCAPGRRLPLLGPPGHGGVGARAVPAARHTGRAPQRSAPGSRTAKAAILPALQCEAGQRSPARALRVTRDGLRPPLRLIFPGWVGAYRKDGRKAEASRYPSYGLWIHSPHGGECGLDRVRHLQVHLARGRDSSPEPGLMDHPSPLP